MDVVDWVLVLAVVAAVWAASRKDLPKGARYAAGIIAVVCGLAFLLLNFGAIPLTA